MVNYFLIEQNIYDNIWDYPFVLNQLYLNIRMKWAFNIRLSNIQDSISILQICFNITKKSNLKSISKSAPKTMRKRDAKAASKEDKKVKKVEKEAPKR